jgi:D-tyrosyl-tRNA(Tyr) deacylase
MRVVVQRVSNAKVTVRDTGIVSGEIGIGYLVLVGFKKGDTPRLSEQIAEKISKLRVMSDAGEKMNLSLKDAGGKMLVVSQFTLYADTSAGNRPSFVDAEDPEKAKELFELFVASLKKQNIQVETGSFGDYMDIEANLDGPVTIIYE